MTPEKRYALDLQEQDRLRNNKPIEETIQRNSERVMRDTNNNLSSLPGSYLLVYFVNGIDFALNCFENSRINDW